MENVIKKFLSKAILTAAIIGCIGGAGVMNVSAGTVTLDVTSSNVSGMVPKDPYSKMTTKSDAEQSFYITLNTLSLYFLYFPNLFFHTLMQKCIRKNHIMYTH